MLGSVKLPFKTETFAAIRYGTTFSVRDEKSIVTIWLRTFRLEGQSRPTVIHSTDSRWHG